MAKINTAVFPIGGLGTRFLPATKAMPKEMLPIIDKPLIQFVVEEARACGIERLVFVTGRQKHAVENHFDHMIELESTLAERGKKDALSSVNEMLGLPGEVIFIRQMRPLGLGHAVWAARHVVQNDPFAVLLADDFIDAEVGCLQQMVEAYENNAGNYLACMEVPEGDVSSYGILAPEGRVDDRAFAIKGMVEKPNTENAPSRHAVIGRYLLEPGVMKALEHTRPGAGGEIQLTDAIAHEIFEGRPVHGLRFEGDRFDCGSKAGFLQATVAFGLQRDELRDELLDYLRHMMGLRNAAE